jgi:acyl-CoA hydrolase
LVADSITRRIASADYWRSGHCTYKWLLFLAVFLVVACGKPKEAALPAGMVVLALGDSLTAGNGVASVEAWPALLAAKTGWKVVNGGVSGDTSAGGLDRLPTLLEQNAPGLVLVTLGGNDMLRHLPEAETVTNLQRIIVQSRSSGARVVLLATPKPSLAGAIFNKLSAPEFYRQIANDQQVPLIEDAFPEVLSESGLKGDPLHPNAAGHAVLAEKIADTLKKIGYLR